MTYKVYDLSTGSVLNLRCSSYESLCRLADGLMDSWVMVGINLTKGR